MRKIFISSAILIVFIFSVFSSDLISENLYKNISLPEFKREYWPTKGWIKSNPEKQNIDSSALNEAEKYFSRTFPSAFSLMIIRHGYVLIEKYYNGSGPEQNVPVFSITKTVAAALTGICIKQGLIESENSPLSDYFPEYFKNPDDPRKNSITLKNMLSHTTGLSGSGGSGDDIYKKTLSEKLFASPGQEFKYSNSVPDLISLIIARVTENDTRSFAEENLFGPLGINAGNWETDAKGRYLGVTGLHLSTSDLAKLGYLYLNGGNWDGTQIFERRWAEESAKIQTQWDNKFFGYMFWIRPMNDKGKYIHNTDFYIYYAYGHRGQYIGIVPELDMIVVMTSDSESADRDNFYLMELIDDFMKRYIFNTVIDAGEIAGKRKTE